jgi:hypothetical protein
MKHRQKKGIAFRKGIAQDSIWPLNKIDYPYNRFFLKIDFFKS